MSGPKTLLLPLLPGFFSNYPCCRPVSPGRDTDGALIPNNEVPGFIRVEPLGGDADTPTEAGSPEEKVWFQWEIILSR